MQSLWMLAASFFFTWMGVFVKLGSPYFSVAELVFYRCAISLVVIAVMSYFRGLDLKTPHWKRHATRGISGFVSLSLYFYAISLLPLATAVTLNYTSPLFLALLSMLLVKERLQRPLLLAIAIGFGGMVLLLKPTLHANQLFGGLMGLGSGFLAAVAYFNVKQLSRLGEPDWRIVFYFSVISTLGSGIVMVLLNEFHTITVQNWWILLGLGIAATLGQLAMTRAYGKGKILVTGSLAYTTVVFASLLGIVLWGEVLALSSWVAIALIISGGILSIRFVPRSN